MSRQDRLNQMIMGFTIDNPLDALTRTSKRDLLAMSVAVYVFIIHFFALLCLVNPKATRGA